MKARVNQVRIIAGHWRGRRICFPDLPGLRPSADRTRETLFNWLMHELAGSECLDLFTGSGVLALEALSRGAARVVAVDESKQIIRCLEENAKVLGAENLDCLCASWPAVLPQLNGPFDLVFVDPPFNKGLVEPCCDWLLKNNLLKPKAWIYVEQEISAVIPKLPEGWELYREMQTQQVRALLFNKQ